MEYLLLSFITLLISIISGDVEIPFVKAAPRLNNSMYCDYYFACHAEGETLQWIVNNNNISYYSGQSIDDVFTGSISTCSYTSTLLSLKPVSSELLIFDSVLIVSCQSSIDFDVSCTNGSVSKRANIPEKRPNTRAENNITSVNLEHVLNENLVTSESSSCTNIFVCGVDNFFILWQSQENSFAFTAFDNIGVVRQILQDTTTTVEQQAILIGNEPYSLVVVMIVIGSIEINVTCGYPDNTAYFSSISCLETTGSETSTVTQNATIEKGTSINIAIIIGPIVVGACLVTSTIVLIVGSCWRKEQKKRKRISARTRNLKSIESRKKGRLFEGKFDNKVNQIELEYFGDDNEDDEGARQVPQWDTSITAVNNSEEDNEDKEYLTPIKVNEFTEENLNMLVADFKEEFEVLMKVTKSSKSCKAGIRNKEKNRFKGIVPYDFSRVKLESSEGVEGSDYINASYIDDYNGKKKAYIATQEPMANTKADFWRMIYEQNVSTIVMFRETEQWMDMQYWPDVGIPEDQNGTNLQVTYIKLERYVDFEVRTFTMQKHGNAGDETPRSIKHYFFSSWPNKGVPRYSAPLIQFIFHIKSKKIQSDDSPIVVHSKAGSGRTGVFIALYGLMEQMKEDKEIGIFAFVKSMRCNRRHLVKKLIHYVFIYHALNELCISGDTSLKKDDLKEKVKNKDFIDEFELLSRVGRQPIKEDQSDALRHRSKNSCVSSLPYNDSRVKLMSTDNDYISACFVHGYKTTDAYIAAQIPYKETRQDFWNMIWEQQSQTVVLLGPLQERNMRVSKFWPDRSRKYGTLTVTVDSEEEKILDSKEWIFYISKDNEIQKVTFYHYDEWPETEQPEHTGGIRHLISKLKSQQNRRNHKVIMCSDGAGRTGAFITICEMIEMFHEVGYMDFFKLLVLLRIDRADLVKEVEHYKFCHRVLADYIDEKPYTD